MKPPSGLKFSPWVEAATRATTVTTGIRSFQHTATMFVSASQRTPMTLIVQKRNSSAPAAT
jgi:hypothetical protein